MKGLVKKKKPMSHSLAYRSKQNLQPCMNSISTKTSWPKVTKSFGSCYSALHEKSRTIQLRFLL